MPTEKDAYEPGPAEFDRIVSRLCAEDPQFADTRRFAPRIESPRRPTPGDGPFVLACLAVILPMSMVVGGWIGLTAMVTAVIVAARLGLHAAVDEPS